MAEYVRVTDEVKPRREYSIRESQVREGHTVLDKPAAYPDGTPLPTKYTPAKTSAATAAAKKADQSAATKKEN